MNTTDLAPVKGRRPALIEVGMRMRHKATRYGQVDDYYYSVDGDAHNEIGPQEIFMGDERVDWYLASEPIWRLGYES
jgi:hypothetical protein